MEAEKQQERNWGAEGCAWFQWIAPYTWLTTMVLISGHLQPWETMFFHLQQSTVNT